MKLKRTFPLLAIILFSFTSFVYADSELIFNPENGHAYQRIDTPMTWYDAKEHCESIGGHLATITSQNENQFISDHLFRSDSWLGGFQPPGSPEPDGNWRWVTGEAWDYSNWYSGEPNNMGGNEDHLEIGAHDYDTWNDIPGNSNRLSICEWDRSNYFSDFNLKHVLIKFKKLSESDSYYLKGNFTLAENSDGIDLLEEDVNLKVGTSNLEIPAGSFSKIGWRKYKFYGKIDSVSVYMRLTKLKSDSYYFVAWINGVDLTNTPNPVPIELSIGDDMGQTDIWLSGILKSR